MMIHNEQDARILCTENFFLEKILRLQNQTIRLKSMEIVRNKIDS